MARLYKHGQVEAEYRRTTVNIDCTVTRVIRLMTDGKLLQQYVYEYPATNDGMPGHVSKTGWKLASKLKPEVQESPDLLVERYQYTKQVGKK